MMRKVVSFLLSIAAFGGFIFLVVPAIVGDGRDGREVFVFIFSKDSKILQKCVLLLGPVVIQTILRVLYHKEFDGVGVALMMDLIFSPVLVCVFGFSYYAFLFCMWCFIFPRFVSDSGGGDYHDPHKRSWEWDPLHESFEEHLNKNL